MKIFHCGECDQLVFFENTSCVSCGHALAFLTDRMEIGTLEPDGEDRWQALSPGTQGRAYRLCQNYSKENVCNWAVPDDDPNPFCLACRLTRVIPDLSRPGVRERWAKLEAAKRRLIFNLLSLHLPLLTKTEDPEGGLAFEFLADPEPGTPDAKPVLTGHDNGLITINVAEADDVEREKRRNLLHEPYRTLLGHFRHEVGHYYWDRLIRDTDWIEPFRKLFGDDREDYGEALQRHYKQGAPADWSTSFISSYASSHPWEDWAETWAHYLHMYDTLDTAVVSGLSLRPKRKDEPALTPDIEVSGKRPAAFDLMVERWFTLTFVLNNLNRGMGLPDAYPFVLSTPVVEKLRFIHEVIAAAKPSKPSLPEKPGTVKKTATLGTPAS
jgi:hypothetical protein